MGGFFERINGIRCTSDKESGEILIKQKRGFRFKTPKPSFCLGGPHRDRTCDPLIKSQLLYQLS